MTTPTPEQLSTSLLDVALGYDAEILGIRPDPTLGHHIKAMARRVLDRVPAGDERLSAFTGCTDPSGYVWLAQPIHQHLAYAARQPWSFERWFTALADVVRAQPPLDPEYLADLAQNGAIVEQVAEAGYRPNAVRTDETSAAIILTRQQGNDRG